MQQFVNKHTSRNIMTTIARTFLYTALSVFALTSCQFSSKKKLDKNPNVAQLDSVKQVISEALGVLENFPKDEMMVQLAAVEELQAFFINTDYRFTREQYLGEIDKIGSAQRAFVKVFQALPALRDEANLAHEQLSSLRKAYAQNQISDEEFAQYLQQESEAAEMFMFNYNKRVTRALELNQALDTIIPSAEALRKEALENTSL
jgi:hypothetical protein